MLALFFLHFLDRLMFSNKTMENKSFVHQDRVVLYAGHIFVVFYCLIFLLGFLGMQKIIKKKWYLILFFFSPGNFAVIYVGIRKKNYRNVTNCYVINLAFADLCFISLSIPYTTYLGLVDILPLGEKFCKIYMLLTYVGWLIRPYVSRENQTDFVFS